MNFIHPVLILPRIRIQNANALSSAFTIGFPAMTAWLGSMRALQLKLNEQDYSDLKLIGVGVVCHQFDLDVNTEQSERNLRLMKRSPTSLDEKDTLNKGDSARFIPEARCDLTVSLVIELEGLQAYDHKQLLDDVSNLLHAKIKMASGDILGFEQPQIKVIDDVEEQTFFDVVSDLMPGYALIERKELVQQAMEQGQDAIDAILDYLVIHHQSEFVTELNKEDKPIEKLVWSSKRKESNAWLVPISSGFQQLTEPNKQQKQRDQDTRHSFAESIITLGEFVMPYKLQSLNQLLWRYQFSEQSNTSLYLCTQNMN